MLQLKTLEKLKSLKRYPRKVWSMEVSLLHWFKWKKRLRMICLTSHLVMVKMKVIDDV